MAENCASQQKDLSTMKIRSFASEMKISIFICTAFFVVTAMEPYTEHGPTYSWPVLVYNIHQSHMKNTFKI